MKNITTLVKEILILDGQRGTEKQISRYLKLFKNNVEIITNTHKTRFAAYNKFNN